MTKRPFKLARQDQSGCHITGPIAPTLPETPINHTPILVNALNDAYEAGAKSTATDALERRLRIAEAQVTAARLWCEKSDGEGSPIEWMDKAKADAEKETT